jgi:hypothetical protein
MEHFYIADRYINDDNKKGQYCYITMEKTITRTRHNVTLYLRTLPVLLKLYHAFGKSLCTYIRNIAQADLQKVFANKIKQVQARIDARGHHFQQLL